jgi:hypothetical protein
MSDSSRSANLVPISQITRQFPRDHCRSDARALTLRLAPDHAHDAIHNL